MFTVRNIAFEKVLEKYSVKDLTELSNEQLQDACENFLRFEADWVIDPKTRRRIKIDRPSTFRKLEARYSFDNYQGDSYATEEQLTILRENNVDEQLKQTQRGDEVFKLYQSMGLGFHNLKPGESRKINVSALWIKEVLMNSPQVKAGEMVIEDNENKPINLPSEIKLQTRDEEVKKKTEEDYAGVSYLELRKVARTACKGEINVVGKTREELIRIILSH